MHFELRDLLINRPGMLLFLLIAWSWPVMYQPTDLVWVQWTVQLNCTHWLASTVTSCGSANSTVAAEVSINNNNNHVPDHPIATYKIAHTTYLAQIRAVNMLQQWYDTRICPWRFSHAESRLLLNLDAVFLPTSFYLPWNGTPHLADYVIVE